MTKKQNFGCLSNCHYCMDRTQNLPSQPPTHSAPDFIQIRSLLVEL